MPDIQRYHASDDEYATSTEVVVNDPVANADINLSLSVESGPPSKFVVFATSTPSGQYAPYIDAKIEILNNNLVPLPLSSQSATDYISPDEKIAILVNPQGHSWRVSIKQGVVPFAVSAFAFHPMAASSIVAAHPPAPRFRCRVCKTTAKALALAIVAAAGAAVLPAALLASVGAFLGGIGALAAGAFINSVIGDTADVVAEKLCMAVRLCP